ncbi:transcriptional regulator [Embleya hyalina]|uniref:Transcriptional regulator n=1 Tax=Embleya hyalina TaxID=516124 RepID=A0A401YD16_9ACTN|nr:transcriptional regulator [Embleya hyalina]
MWESPGVVPQEGVTCKVVDHPHVGTLTLDCDVLHAAGSDLRVIVHTAEPDTPDAERLALLGVLGTRSLTG